MTDIRYPYQGGVTSTDGQGLVIDSITGQLTLVLDGTSLSKSSSGLKWNDASTQFIDVSSSSTAFRVTQRGTGAALLVEDSTNPDSTPFVIDANGNVGIGTTSPRVNLELGLDDSSSVIGANLAQVGLLLRNFNPTTNNWSVIEFDSANGGVAAAIGTQVKDHTNNYGDFVVATRGTGGWGEKLRVTANGNVGIGTTTPTAILQTLTKNGYSFPATSGVNQSGVQVRMTSQPGATLDFGTETSGKQWIQATNSGDLSLNYPLLLNPNGGNVGIGTTSPQAILDVLPSGGKNIFLTGGSATGSELKLTNTGTYHFSIYNSGNSNLTFANTSTSFAPNTAGTPLMSITSGGNVGIGTTAPSRTLDLEGADTNTTISGATKAALAIVNTNTSAFNQPAELQFFAGSTAANQRLGGVSAFYTTYDATNGVGGDVAVYTKQSTAVSPDERLRITSTGNVGIGTSNPQGKLEITTNSTTPAVLITQQGSGHCLVVEDSTNPDSTPFVIDTDGRVGIGTSTPESALHLAQTNGVAESATCLFAEKDTTPGNPADGTQVKMYMKADKIIFQYNDGGTVRYKYLDLTGTTDTWTATTTAP